MTLDRVETQAHTVIPQTQDNPGEALRGPPICAGQGRRTRGHRTPCYHDTVGTTVAAPQNLASARMGSVPSTSVGHMAHTVVRPSPRVMAWKADPLLGPQACA